MADRAISISHNLIRENFMWLWMKYVHGVNDTYHCTNCLRGPYGKKLSKHNDLLNETTQFELDEQDPDSFSAIYICGVIKRGYPKKNYIHNLHAAIKPAPEGHDSFQFEDWELNVTNGVFLRIPPEEELPERYKTLPAEFTTCRIFRWAVCSELNRISKACLRIG